MNTATEVSTVLDRHRDELEWLFMELYGDRAAMGRLESEMEQAWNARSPELKSLKEKLPYRYPDRW